MFSIRFLLIFRLLKVLHCDWIEIAQTANSFSNGKHSLKHFSIDRSHFLSSLNINNESIVMDNTNEYDENRYRIFGDESEAENHLFRHSIPIKFKPHNSFHISNVTINSMETSVISSTPVNLWTENVLEEHPSSSIPQIKTKIVVDSSLLNVSKAPTIDKTVKQSPINLDPPKTKHTADKKVILKPVLVVKKLKYQPFDLSSVFGFLKDLQKSFVSRSLSTIENKIKFLESFKETVLNHIDKHFKLLWPYTDQSRKKRAVRSHHGGGMEFPSAETALMTISFLTLAVFLIKLVLQVIHTIKSKHMTFGSMQAAQMDSPIKIIKKNRNARRLSLLSTSNENLRTITERIMELNP